MQENIPRQIETTLKIATTVVFFVGCALLIPQIADSSGVFGNWAAKSVTAIESNSQALNNTSGEVALSDDTYEPPNHGGPDSVHGSGTR